MNEQVKATGLTSAGGDLSLIGLFLQADWVVETVLSRSASALSSDW